MTRTVTCCPSTRPRCGVTVNPVKVMAFSEVAAAGPAVTKARDGQRAAAVNSNRSALGFKVGRPPRPERTEALVPRG